MVVYQVQNQVDVSMNWLVLSHLWLHPVQPVNESLQSVFELAGEQQCLLQLVLPAETCTYYQQPIKLSKQSDPKLKSGLTRNA